MISEQRSPTTQTLPKTGSARAIRLEYSDPMNLSAIGSPLYERDLTKIRGLVRESWYSQYKPKIDLAFAIALSLVLLPVAISVLVLVRISSPGPALYSQTRLGRFARPFRILKFRSMRHNCEKQSGAKWASRNDSRVTPVGKLLRISHLDELPQLVNVLRGEMSLVGPRPERPEFIATLEKTVDNYRLRMLVKPGVTGLAQVYLPPDVDISSVRMKVIYDLYYLRHMSFWLDLRLLAATPLQAIGFPCPLVRAVLLLPTEATIETESMPEEFDRYHYAETKPMMSPSSTKHDIEPYPLSDSKFGTSIA